MCEGRGLKKKVSLIRLEYKFQNALPPQTQTSSLSFLPALWKCPGSSCELSLCHPVLPWLHSPCCTLMGWARVSYSCDGHSFVQASSCLTVESSPIEMSHHWSGPFTNHQHFASVPHFSPTPLLLKIPSITKSFILKKDHSWTWAMEPRLVLMLPMLLIS